MKRLEQLLEPEFTENRPGHLVFYSCSSLPDPKPIDITFSEISAYAESLNKQFGVPSTSTSPRTPSPSVGIETFDLQRISEALNKTYQPSENDEGIAYAADLNSQFSIPSPVIKPAASHAPDPKTFDIEPVLYAVNNPFCPSHSDNPFAVYSPPAKPTDTPVYEQPEFKIPEIAEPKFEPISTPSYKGWISNKEAINSKPYKYLDNFSKNEIKILTKGIYTKSDFHDVLGLFKNNDLPNVYEKIKQNLHMKPKSVTAIVLTNPLYTKNADEEGPNFLEYDNSDKEIRLPVTQPKFIPFIKTDKQTYRDIALNSFLPHEQAHANINEKYGDIVGGEGLVGFNEHLANTMAQDSLGQPYVKAETEYQNMWAGNPKKSDMAEDYTIYLKSKKLIPDVPANIATVNILENPWLKKKTDSILNHTLEKLYPNDEKFKEDVSKGICELSKIYQTQALKITGLSKKDTLLSNFKAKRILSEVEKKTFKFLEEF